MADSGMDFRHVTQVSQIFTFAASNVTFESGASPNQGSRTLHATSFPRRMRFGWNICVFATRIFDYGLLATQSDECDQIYNRSIIPC
jgi:hypothetical protein